MRRKDREVTDDEKINQIILSCHCVRLGLCDEGEAYIVPLSFGFEAVGGKRFFYFHSAKAGRKIELISKSPRAAFELDTNYRLIEAETACGHTAGFQSVTGTGIVTFIEEPGEKKAALQALMAHTAGTGAWDIPEKALDTVCVFKLEVIRLSCKENGSANRQEVSHAAAMSGYQ